MKASLIHPGWLRITHWLNAIAVVLMVMSGWQVYNASPVFADWTFPAAATLGGWLGGALQWHFAAMWLLAANFLVYLVLNIVSGRFRRKFWPLSPVAVVADLRAALRGKLSHADLSRYNAVQKFTYAAVLLDIAVLVVSGLAIWKPVQLSFLTALVGGYDFGRVVHFCAMAILVAFVVLHVAMVLLVPRSLLTMIRGR